nr:sensor histidine kinase KdpD [Segniliparus rugosus]
MSADTSQGSQLTPRKRGQLRIYLGAAPGVGKTYAMLAEAHRRQERGADVVVAVVATHGREQTAELLDGLEVVPSLELPYRGAVLEEMDLAGVLRRAPELALVDELAHTNAPGSANEKRWQDVQALLEAGVDVLSTVNVQHLESLNDVVAQITGVTQHETVPDVFVRSAAQIELVDITPEALRARMSHGNIYAQEKVEAALRNYFRAGNLTALRELALLWLADQVDAALAKYRQDHRITDVWETRERVIVSVTGGPESPTLIRRARRIASKSGAELMVLHIVRGDGLASVAEAELGRLREFAASVGASLHTVVGDDVPMTLLEFARGVNATQLVLGTSRRSRFAQFFSEGIGMRVVRESGKIDVHMVTHEEAGRRRSWRPRTGGRLKASWAAAIVAPPVVAALLKLAGGFIDFTSATAVFFAVVLMVSLLGGVAPAACSAIISGFLLNYLFAPPLLSFAVKSPGQIITIIVMVGLGVAVAALVDSATSRAREARHAAKEAELLTLFAGVVLRGADVSELLAKVRETYALRAVSLVRAGAVVSSAGEDPPTSAVAAQTAVDSPDGESTLLLDGPRTFAGRDRRVLEAVAAQAAALVRQADLAGEAAKADGLAEADRLRRALLSAVSHDLRTPLAAVKAAVSSLRSQDVEFSPEDVAELLATIEESADQLTALVGNLLDSSRLAAGVIAPQRKRVYVDEVAHRAILSLPASARKRVQVTPDVNAVIADLGLLERVLANLIDNALRYAPDSQVTVHSEREEGEVVISVVDHGPGIRSDQRERAFEAFGRLHAASSSDGRGDRDNTVGVGLGLSVVRGFAEAMGGQVVVAETPGGGATLQVWLPDANTPKRQLAHRGG